VPFGDSKDVVDGLDPFRRDLLLSLHRREGLAKRGGKSPGFQEQSFCCLGIGLGQSEKLCAALDRDDAGGLQKYNEPLP
jgi:hypothetical protein